jgi:hypothetical protein
MAGSQTSSKKEEENLKKEGKLFKLGRAVLDDPIKPPLKAPATKRLNLNHDEWLTIFAFKSSLRRSSSVTASRKLGVMSASRQGLKLVHFPAQRKRFLLQGCM